MVRPSCMRALIACPNVAYPCYCIWHTVMPGGAGQPCSIATLIELELHEPRGRPTKKNYMHELKLNSIDLYKLDSSLLYVPQIKADRSRGSATLSDKLELYTSAFS